MFQGSRVQAFFADESGAVTTDWVVVTAAIVGLCLAMIGMFREALSPQAQNLGSELLQYTIDTTF